LIEHLHGEFAGFTACTHKVDKRNWKIETRKSKTTALNTVAPKALWSAAACWRFYLASLLASSPLQHPAHGQQAGLVESGSKLPHSKPLRAFSWFLAAAGSMTDFHGRVSNFHFPVSIFHFPAGVICP
jgi:hypothetical protein